MPKQNTNTHLKRFFAAACLLLPLATTAEIYRYVDENGNIHFSDQAPENKDADNLQADIDEAVERNTLPSLKTQRENDPEWVKSQREEREKNAKKNVQAKANYDKKLKDWKRELKQAQTNLKDALLNQIKGKEAIEGDFIGKAGGGARPSESYHQRQTKLASEVEQAQKMLTKIKKAKPVKPKNY